MDQIITLLQEYSECPITRKGNIIHFSDESKSVRIRFQKYHGLRYQLFVDVNGILMKFMGVCWIDIYNVIKSIIDINGHSELYYPFREAFHYNLVEKCMGLTGAVLKAQPHTKINLQRLSVHLLGSAVTLDPIGALHQNGRYTSYALDILFNLITIYRGQSDQEWKRHVKERDGRRLRRF